MIERAAAFLATVLLAVPAMAGAALDRVQSTGILTMSSDPDYPPQSFLNDQNEMDGFDVDVGKEIARRMNAELRIVTPAWEVAGRRLGARRISVARSPTAAARC